MPERNTNPLVKPDIIQAEVCINHLIFDPKKTE
jgi:hypothetical protein